MRLVWRYIAILLLHHFHVNFGQLQLSQKITPHLQPTYYGTVGLLLNHGIIIAIISRLIPQMSKIEVWDKPSNVANESGNLEPHMDMSPYESQPGLSILQCIRYRKQCKTEDFICPTPFVMLDVGFMVGQIL